MNDLTTLCYSIYDKNMLKSQQKNLSSMWEKQKQIL